MKPFIKPSCIVDGGVDKERTFISIGMYHHMIKVNSELIWGQVDTNHASKMPPKSYCFLSPISILYTVIF